ncbi:iron-sulfur cluster assembly scaffold protein [Maricaulis sp. MIT060901]|uniref:iron-sulfur cluster assembly scaffold protein n=1 Tax=Maricaulis sp. MIT060901 TaxID=3096993 RepID=UPI00399B0562
MIDDLYSSDVLRLAANIEHIGRLDAPHARVRRVSRLCGSELELDLVIDGGVVADHALRVKACALGQASAAVLSAHLRGASLDDVTAARDGLLAMLKSDGPVPEGRFTELAALDGAREYPARHQSVMLAFEAAVEALTTATETTTRLTG